MAALAIALLAAALVWLQAGATPWVYALTWMAATLGGPLLVATLMERGDSLLGRMLSGRVITYLGRRSYALYLWHYVWLTWLRSLGWTGVLLALALSLASAELSWRLVESRFLARKRRMESLRTQSTGVSPHVVALGATG
jgi:peptidoglycan/LPS O-acetylase OafA/YrhL